MARPVIIGCGLQVYPGHQYWGDLWEEGDCWIFNASGDSEGLPHPLSPDGRTLFLSPYGEDYFERRNVFVVSKALAFLSLAAQHYLSKDF